MPTIGQLQRGRHIGSKSRDQLYIWHACVGCGRERWVAYIKDKPRSELCRSCATSKARWQGGRIKQGPYYKVRLAPDNFFYAMADHKGYVLEHRLIMAKSLNRCLLPWEVVHHRNGIKNDNRLENLQLLPHKRFHIVDSNVKSYIARLEATIAELKEKLKSYAKVDRGAELPNRDVIKNRQANDFYAGGYEHAKADMLKEGWVKEILDD